MLQPSDFGMSVSGAATPTFDNSFKITLYLQRNAAASLTTTRMRILLDEMSRLTFKLERVKDSSQESRCHLDLSECAAYSDFYSRKLNLTMTAGKPKPTFKTWPVS